MAGEIWLLVVGRWGPWVDCWGLWWERKRRKPRRGKGYVNGVCMVYLVLALLGRGLAGLKQGRNKVTRKCR